MGLLGIVLNATLRLRRIETTYFRQKPIKATSLEAMLEALEENDRTFTYSVAPSIRSRRARAWAAAS